MDIKSLKLIKMEIENNIFEYVENKYKQKRKKKIKNKHKIY